MLKIDTFTVIWIVVAISFIVLFFYVLLSSRNLKLRSNFAVLITVFLFIFAGSLATLIQQRKLQTGQTQANQQIVPKELKIQQTGDNQILITWNTDKTVFQSVKYKTDGRDWMFAFDEKMTEGVSRHKVKIDGLERDRKYLIIIVSGKTQFSTYKGAEISITLR